MKTKNACHRDVLVVIVGRSHTRNVSCQQSRLSNVDYVYYTSSSTLTNKNYVTVLNIHLKLGCNFHYTKVKIRSTTSFPTINKHPISKCILILEAELIQLLVNMRHQQDWSWHIKLCKREAKCAEALTLLNSTTNMVPPHHLNYSDLSWWVRVEWNPWNRPPQTNLIEVAVEQI